MNKPEETNDQSSPPWQTGTRLMAGVLLIIFLMLLLFVLRSLLTPLVLAFILAYLLHPVVSSLTFDDRIPRWASITAVYLVLLAVLAGMTTGVGLAVSQGIDQLAGYFAGLAIDLPDTLETLSGFQFQLGPWSYEIPIDTLEPLLAEIATSVSPLLLEVGDLLQGVFEIATSTISLIFTVMLFAFYLLLDIGVMDKAILRMIPRNYHGDVRRLLAATSDVWQAFIRGQALLAVIIGVTVWVMLTILGVNFALPLALVAGILEFIPFFGPFISEVAAVLVVIFQGSNWLGVSPLVFSGIVLAVYLIIQQIENNVLVPRIIGSRLNLHPLAVLLAVLAGGKIAGLLGVLLSAPTLATIRIWGGYIYRKVVGLETWPRIPKPSEPEPVSAADLRAKLQQTWDRLNVRRRKKP